MKEFVLQRKVFPDPRQTLSEGLVMVGGSLRPEILLEAYSFGIFPWPQEGFPLLWFCPEKRGILDFAELHLARSFQKFLRHTPFKVTFNTAFAEVIAGCSLQYRPGQMGTWITPQIVSAYTRFHELGYAHSVECWEGRDLVGGLYGVYVGGIFSGESMFFKRANASKMCLYYLIMKLQECGLTWMDIQMVSEGLKTWGGKYITRDQFLQRLANARGKARNVKIRF